MRIAVVTGEYPTPSAPEKAMFVRDQVVALRGVGHQVAVVHHDPPTLRRAVNRLRRRLPGRATPAVVSTTGPTAGSVPSIRARLRTAGRLLHDGVGRSVAVEAMVRDLNRLDPAPQVVHAHNVFPAGLAAARFARASGTPFVVTEHSSAFLRGQLSDGEIRTARSVYEAAARVVAVSPGQAEAIPAEDVAVVPNVLPEEFTLRPVPAAIEGHIVSIGTLMPHKGMDVLIRAYSDLSAPLRAIHRLVIVGDGPDAPRLRRLAEDEGVADRIDLVGHLPRARVAEVVRGAALLVSASPVETFGMTLIEGLASGVPFVAVRSGGPESVWFPEAGVLVPDGRRASVLAGMTDGLRIGAEDDGHRRNEARRRFGGEVVAARLSEIYRAAAGSGGVGTARRPRRVPALPPRSR